MHIIYVFMCISNYTIIGSHNGVLTFWCRTIIRTNAGSLSFGPSGTNLNEILLIKITKIFIQENSFENVAPKMVAILSASVCSSSRWRKMFKISIGSLPEYLSGIFEKSLQFWEIKTGSVSQRKKHSLPGVNIINWPNCFAEHRKGRKRDEHSRGWFGFAPSQWEMSLQSNAVSRWLGANLKSTLTWVPHHWTGCDEGYRDSCDFIFFSC